MPVKVDQHSKIVTLAIAGAGTDERRRSEVLNACKTLDDIKAEPVKEGFILSRQALYLCLVQRRTDSCDGKLHVRTVPVEIRKAANNLRSKHQDADFAFAIKAQVKDVASFFGSENVFVQSIDDKAKVPIGVTVAKIQATKFTIKRSEYG